MSGHRRRYREVTETMSRHGLAFLVTDPAHPTWAPFHHGLFGHKRQPEPYTRADHLRLALEELGPTFVKLGQILSTRPDLLPPEYLVALSRLQDAAPAVPSSEILQIVAAELSGDPHSIFAELDAEPLASASIGQVHGAILIDGTRVVVKVRRPGAVETVNEDLEILKEVAARASARWDALADYDVVGLVNEFSETLRGELDYEREARNAERFAANFAQNPAVRIPRVYWGGTTSRMLTLERVTGIKVTDIDALDAAGIDKRALAVSATEVVCQMIFIDGVFHADPHPGNLFIEPDGRVALIDFGMVGELNDQLRGQLASVLLAASRSDAQRMARALLALDPHSNGADPAALRADLEILLAKYRGLPIGELAIGPLVTSVLDIVRAHHIAVPNQLVLLFKMLVMVEGLGVQLDPDFHMGDVVTPFAERLIASEWSPARVAQKTALLITDALEYAGEFPQLVRSLAASAELREQSERRHAAELDRAIRDIERTGHQLATGVVAAVAVTGAVNGLIASRGLSARARLAIALLTGAAPISAYAAWTLVRSNSRIWN